MRAEELDNLTDQELLANANDCFIQTENNSPEEKLLLFLKAQFYLTALSRKRDERVARRDFWMEIAVIALIGIEIILSVVGLYAGYQQGKVLDKQTIALTHMDTSTAATADAMTAAKASLETLAGDQAKSLDRLKNMNDNLQASLTTTRKMANAMSDTNAKLQASLTTTGTMAEALKEQLRILQTEQTERLAQEAKKPNLELFIGGSLVIDRFGLTFSGPEFLFHTQDDTSTTFELRLINTGGADTNGTDLRVCVVSKSDDIGLQISNSSYEVTPDLAETHNPIHNFLIHLGHLQRGADVPLSITFSYPKAQPQFYVFFYVHADEIQQQTQIGSMMVTPRKPKN